MRGDSLVESRQMANDPKDDELVDLDFTGVFKVEELRPEPPPPPPKKMPEEFVIGAKAMKKGSSFINMARARPARKVDPAKTSILLVEDDKTTRIILDMICKKAGFQTRQAADAATFLATMNKPPNSIPQIYRCNCRSFGINAIEAKTKSP